MKQTTVVLITMTVLLALGTAGIAFAEVEVTPKKVMEGQQVTVHIKNSNYGYAYVIFFEGHSLIPNENIVKLNSYGNGAVAFDTKTMHKHQLSKIPYFGENYVRVIIYADGVMQEVIIPVLLFR